MMRIAATILVLTAAAVLASPWHAVIARKKANAGSDISLLFEENFDAPGYENSWSTSDPNGAVVTTNTQAQTGSYSLYIDGSAGSGVDHYAYHDLGAGGPTDYVVRVYFYRPNAQSNADVEILNSHDSASAIDSFNGFRILMVNDDEVAVRTDGGTLRTATAADDAWHYVEFHYPSGDWRLNGVDQTATSTDATPNVCRYIKSGEDGDAGDNASVYVDAIAIRDTTGITGGDRWIGPAS